MSASTCCRIEWPIEPVGIGCVSMCMHMQKRERERERLPVMNLLATITCMDGHGKNQRIMTNAGILKQMAYKMRNLLLEGLATEFEKE